jgi:hypothetical protein
MSLGGLTFRACDGGCGEGVCLTFFNLDTEVVLELGELEIRSSESISLGLFECFGFEGGQGGIVEFLGVNDGALFSLMTGGVDEFVVSGEDAGMGHIHLFGGPGDDILVNSLVDEHGPGVLAEVVGSSGDPSSEARIICVHKRWSTVSNNGVDQCGLYSGKFVVVPFFGALVEGVVGRVDKGLVKGMKVLSAGEGSRLDRGITQALHGLKATHAMVLFRGFTKGVFVVTVIVEINVQCSCDSRYEMEIISLLGVEASKIEGVDFVTM